MRLNFLSLTNEKDMVMQIPERLREHFKTNRINSIRNDLDHNPPMAHSRTV